MEYLVRSSDGLAREDLSRLCCISRLTDDQAQTRVRLEAEAVEQILFLVQRGEILWITSPALLHEFDRNPSAEKRVHSEALVLFASEIFEMNASMCERARHLEIAGYGSYDALHLAAAESSRCDALLTTDDRFGRQAGRGIGRPLIAVRNPVSWLKEIGH